MRMQRQNDHASLFLFLFLSVFAACLWFTFRENRQDKNIEGVKKILDNPTPERPEDLGILQRLEKIERSLTAEAEPERQPKPAPRPVKQRRRPRRQALDFASGDAHVGNVSDIQR